MWVSTFVWVPLNSTDVVRQLLRVGTRRRHGSKSNEIMRIVKHGGCAVWQHPWQKKRTCLDVF